MMKVESFGKKLFGNLAHKLIHEVNSDISDKNLDSAEEKLEFLEENLEYSDSNDDVSRSVLMMSYACRPAYTDRFEEAFPILIYDKGNAMIYVRTFEEVVLERYSPLKLLMLCSFISEIFLFMSERHVLERKHHYYLQQTTQALNNAFRRIFKQGFPQNGWTDIQNEASKIAVGFKFLEPFMNKATVCQVAHSILTGNYEHENKLQQTVIITPENNSQQMVNVNTSHCELPATGSQDSVNIALAKVPTDHNAFGNKLQQTNNRLTESPSKQVVKVNTSHCELSGPSSQDLVNASVTEIQMDLPTAGSPTNPTPYLAQSLVYTPAFSISFGTVDQDPQLLNLLSHISKDENDTLMFENQPSEESNFPITIKTADPFNIPFPAQENLTARNPEDEQEPVFRAVKITEDGEVEPCNSNTEVISLQELDDCVSQFESKLTLSSGPEPEFLDNIVRHSESHSEKDKELFSEEENISPSETYGKEENVDHSKSQERNTDDETEPVFRTVQITEGGEIEPRISNTEVISVEELDSCASRFESKLTPSSGPEPEFLDNIVRHSESHRENDKDSVSELFSEENINNSQREIYYEEKNVDPPKNPTFLTAKNPEGEQEPVFRIYKITEDGKREICPPNNEVYSIKELDNCYSQLWKNLTGSESESLDNTLWPSQSHPESDNDSKSEIFYECASEIETLSEENFIDFENETYCIEENVSGPESGTFLLAKNLENEQEPLFRTDKITDNGEIETCPSSNEVFSVQELDSCVAQYWNNLAFSSGSVSESHENILKHSQSQPKNYNYYDSSIETVTEEKVIDSESEACIAEDNVHDSDSSERYCIDENVNDQESKKFLFARSLEGEQEPIFRSVKTENGKNKTCALNNELISEQRPKYYVPLSSGTAHEMLSYGFIEHGSDCINDSFLKKERNPKSEAFSKEENDPKSEIFSKQNSFESENTVLAAGNRTEAFRQRQLNDAFEDVTINEEVSSQKNEAQQSPEIEINFQTDERNISAKTLHLNLDGKNFVVRMPADIPLMFKYNGRNSDAENLENMDG